MSMVIGGASVALVESRGGSMQCEAYPSRLALVLALMDSGSLGGGCGYGCDEHKAALDAVERQLAGTRARIARQDEYESLRDVPAPCKHCNAMTEQEADLQCNRPGDCHGSLLWPEHD